MSTILLHKVWY